MNPDTCRIRVDGQIRFAYGYGVDVEIFESGKKKLWIQIYPDTCGRGLILVNRRFNMAAQIRISNFPSNVERYFCTLEEKIRTSRRSCYVLFILITPM